MAGILDWFDHVCPRFVSPIGGFIYLIFLTYGVHFASAGIYVSTRGTYDLAHPRKQDQRGVLKGYMGGVYDRLRSAHQNCFEALIVVGGALVMAMQQNVDAEVISSLASLICLLRTAYCILYALVESQAIAGLRSLAFLGSLLAALRLLALAAAAAGGATPAIVN
mmetsp:Transcript_31047/g.48852  ORF Transcript_31047/g.48852 Transcript_31047/m.48852 type:complete len:165 (+) Transcript_31047:46-540(+)